MAIKITSLAATKKKDNTIREGYLYKDLFLDIKQEYSYNNKLNRTEYLNDVLASFDVEAVKNSIKNAFLTTPGEKLLSPTFGISLKQYLFEPIDVFTENLIRDDILEKLPFFEPRIEIEDVEVVGNPDQNQYDISLTINIPSLNIYGLSIKNELKSSGYTIL